MPDVSGEITAPHRLWHRSEILAKPSPVPREPGVYGWYFREIPPGVPADGCIRVRGQTLLYVGISPKAPPRNGRRPSRQNLATRLRTHMKGNAYSSTLRLTLGCLLGPTLGIRPQPVASGKRLTFGKGEAVLSGWMDRNTAVAWVVHSEPWLAEEELIRRLSLPLNLAGNQQHPFYRELKRIRAAARKEAHTIGEATK